MKKYYLMAIEFGDSESMINLGFYYQTVEKDYVLMKKYYLMAIELEYSDAMNNLANYYHFVEIDYTLMKKYYLMAIKLGNATAMDNLTDYYKSINSPKEYKLHMRYKDLVSREKLISGIKSFSESKLSPKDKKLLEFISTFEFEKNDDIPSSLFLLSEILKNQIDIMELHFKYTVNAEGYEAAKKDYLSLISKGNQDIVLK